jgi:hypothetical protein
MLLPLGFKGLIVPHYHFYKMYFISLPAVLFLLTDLFAWGFKMKTSQSFLVSLSARGRDSQISYSIKYI